MRYEFASDTTSAICPEAWAALAEANSGSASSYGDDPWTQRACALIREVFETDCEVFFVFSGTAANALALAQVCRSFHSIICHEHAHIEMDECGAPEFFSGGSKLLPVVGRNGKIDLAAAAAAIARQRELHSPKPRAISVTQSTELGTVYLPDELQQIADFARARDLHLHMDGARLANALASLGCTPKEITWQAGVEVLCLGGSKNGIAVGEVVVFFNKELAREFDYRCKQAGQLASRMRFISAAWVGLLRDGTWLANARQANHCATVLEGKLRALGLPLSFPCEANAVFLPLREQMVRDLEARGWRFYKFIEPDIHRLMCAWSSTEKDVDDFVRDLKAIIQ